MNEAWMEVARSYRAMSAAEQRKYWGELTIEQRGLLQAAFEASGKDSVHTLPARRPGCVRLSAFGCGGFFCGIVLVIVAEIALISAGVQIVKDAVSIPNAGGSTGVLSPFSDSDPMPYECREGGIYADPNERFYCQQWAERHSP